VLAQFPKVVFGFNPHSSDTTDVHTTGFGITIDLPIFDRIAAKGDIEINLGVESEDVAKLQLGQRVGISDKCFGAMWDGTKPEYLICRTNYTHQICDELKCAVCIDSEPESGSMLCICYRISVLVARYAR
jgi:hypothetical protein